MNCQLCSEQFAAYLDDILDAGRSSGGEKSHLAECAVCRSGTRRSGKLIARLQGRAVATLSAPSESAVMDRILQQQAIELRRLKMRKRLRVLGISGAMAAAIAAIVIGSYLARRAGPSTAGRRGRSPAAPKPCRKPSTVHIAARLPPTTLRRTIFR